MVVAALALRLVLMAFLYTDRLDPARDHWTFGWETGKVAQSIAAGRGFGSPYPEPTGPTALIPPVYAYLVAGVFRLLGTFTRASALAMLTLNDLFSSLTCLPVFFIARRVFGVPTAVRAGWIWVFFPYAVALPNVNVWETTLTTLLLSLVVLATLGLLERSSRPGPWLGYGALWGIAALTSPAVLSTLPFLGAWVWFRHWRRGENCTGPAAAAALVFLLVTGPWTWRCSLLYGRFVALRGGAGLEVLVGNSSDTSGPANWSMLPGENTDELEKLRRLGEPAYMAEKQREAREIIARRPLRFARLTLRRILNTWTGVWGFPPPPTLDETGLPNVLFYSFVSLLALAGLFRAIRDRRDGLPALVIPLIFYPVVFYLTHSEMRYRHPIDPLVVVLVAHGAVALRERKSKPSPHQDDLPINRTRTAPHVRSAPLEHRCPVPCGDGGPWIGRPGPELADEFDHAPQRRDDGVRRCERRLATSVDPCHVATGAPRPVRVPTVRGDEERAGPFAFLVEESVDADVGLVGADIVGREDAIHLEAGRLDRRLDHGPCSIGKNDAPHPDGLERDQCCPGVLECGDGEPQARQLSPDMRGQVRGHILESEEGDAVPGHVGPVAIDLPAALELGLSPPGEKRFGSLAHGRPHGARQPRNVEQRPVQIESDDIEGSHCTVFVVERHLPVPDSGAASGAP
jgi:hypothetical protein